MHNEKWIENKNQEFPDGPVVRTPCFHGEGLVSIPCRGTKILKQQQKKRKKKIELNMQ